MASAPIFAATPKVGQVQVTTANTARDGTGTLATIWTAGSSGSLIYKIQWTATGTTTANVLRLFITDTGGANPRLIEEIIVPAITPSTTVRVFEYVIIYPQNNPLVLENGRLLRGSTNATETYNVHAFGGDI
jgi:hypothetical protein